uniref:Uncharacterized protein n=1 Tax=Arundo donax TaxID=35708 RepID=A0A0A9FA23_ARUDO
MVLKSFANSASPNWEPNHCPLAIGSNSSHIGSHTNMVKKMKGSGCGRSRNHLILRCSFPSAHIRRI